MASEWDYVVVGGGVVGVATARALKLSRPSASVLLLEKEADLALHTSGRNTGVIHAGYNQKPGTLKAKLCVEGNRRMKAYIRERKLPLLEGGILVTALDESELPALKKLLEQGRANGVEGMALLEGDALRRVEPNARGIAGLHIPSGATTDNRGYVLELAKDALAAGATIRRGARVTDIASRGSGFELVTPDEVFRARKLVNCAGLYADKVAGILGAGRDYVIVPFRGEYYTLKPARREVLRSVVFAAPDPAFPYVGIHWTRIPNGTVLVGPNAILALGRESYGLWDFNVRETVSMLADARFWKLTMNPDFMSLLKKEGRTSFVRSMFLARAMRLMDGVKAEDFEPGSAGNRAQLIDSRGRLVDDLVVERAGDSIHVVNGISPAFTCSLPFAEYLAEQIG